MGSELFTEIHYFSVIYLNAFLLLFSLIKYSGFYLLAQIKNTSWHFFSLCKLFSPLCLHSKSLKDNLSCIIKALIYLVAECIPGS